jgi:hypothetical protein
VQVSALLFFALHPKKKTLCTLIPSPSYNRIRTGQFFTFHFFFPPPKIFLLYISSPSCYQPSPDPPQHTPRKQCLTHSPRHCRSRYVHWVRPRPPGA